MQEMIPLRGKILVKNIPDHKQTASGLWIADSVKEIPNRGEVIALGLPYQDKNGKIYEWDIDVGETVHYKRKWDQNNVTHYILLRDDVFAVEPLRAVRDLIIVKRIYTGKIDNSTLVIPDGLGIQSNWEDYYGLVISVGIDDKFGLKAGDKIHYSRNEGMAFEVEGEEYFSIKPRAILASIT